MSLGNELKIIRKNAQLTQDDVSQQLGISNETLRDIERGKGRMELIMRYLEVLGYELTFKLINK